LLDRIVGAPATAAPEAQSTRMAAAEWKVHRVRKLAE
jgi:hypothetical protein